jgi:predicted TIM-barrel fold metal-dependent hydrolase
MAYDKLTISSDSHILEVPEIFDGLTARFGEAAPSIVYDPERGDVLMLGNGRRAASVGRFGIAGHYVNDPETQEMMRQGYKAMRPGALDPIERLKDQELDGVDAEVLLPSVLLAMNNVKDGAIVAATYRNYNDWVRNYAAQAPKRLFPTACLPMHEIDLAIAELERALREGHVGANIPCVAPADRPYTDHFYDRFWAAAQELGTPLIMHTITSTQPNHGMPDMGATINYGLLSFAMQRTIAEIICSGVCARYPGLRFVPTEWETGWIAHFLQRMDWSLIRTGAAGLPPELTEPFSHYFHENFWVTFEDDRIGLETRYTVGVRNLMWGSDFPHHDSTFPRSRQVLDEIFEDIPDDERLLITALNCRDLYRLPLEMDGV